MSDSLEMTQWKVRHGIDPHANQDELLMTAEELRSKSKSWCIGCDRQLPVRDMKLITRKIDPYKQIDEGATDYIKESNRVRMCPECFKTEYEAEQ